MKSNRKLIVAFVALFALACTAHAGGQKLKDKKKEKRFEPVVKQNVADYAGRYIGIVPDYYLEISSGADGQLSVTSHEGTRHATLRGVRVEGARMTATRVYANGATKAFEGTFVNRILNGESAFGIVVENVNVEFEDTTFNKLFYRLDSNP